MEVVHRVSCDRGSTVYMYVYPPVGQLAGGSEEAGTYYMDESLIN